MYAFKYLTNMYKLAFYVALDNELTINNSVLSLGLS